MSSNVEEMTSIGSGATGLHKVVEVGLLYRLPKLRLGIIFEQIPVWLGALDHSFVESISFLGIDSMDMLISKLKNMSSSSLFIYIIQTFERNLYKFKQDLRSCNLILISGSISFFHQIMTDFECESFLFSTELHTKVRHIPTTIAQLHRASHVQFGGPTKFQTLFAMSSDTSFFKIPVLRRNLSAFIDFGLRPTHLSSPLQFLDQNSMVHPKMLQLPVRYATSFSATGFGFRCLNGEELGRIFGLPKQFLCRSDVKVFNFTPIQILDSIFRQFVQHHFGAVKLQRPQCVMLPTPLPVLESSPVFLPSLQRVLPQDWRNVSEIAEKAAKADDATVPLHLWNKRITCFWPNSEWALHVLRKFFLRLHFRNVFHGYCEYLRQRYESTYSDFLVSRSAFYVRRFDLKRLGGISFPSIHYSLHSQKRKSFHEDSKTKSVSKLEFDNGVKNGSHLMPLMHLKTPKIKFKLKVENCEQNILVLERIKEELIEDIGLGIKTLSTYFRSSFFEWTNGSSLLFWNWPRELQTVAKFGFDPFIIGPLPTHKQRASTFKSPMYEKILSKVVKAIERGYLEPSHRANIKSLIDYFAVDKAGSDIRVVFNGTSCGLNAAVWAPNFWLPTSKSMSRSIGFNYRFIDLDLGEMFLNFPLHPELRKFSGVDLAPFKKDLDKALDHIKWPEPKNRYAVWTRDWMGFAPSPEWACRFYYFAEEFIRGYEKALSNPLRWDRVVLNLIGSETYNPALPQVFKWNEVAGKIAGDLKAYVDDLRAIGWSHEHAWQIARHIASRLQYLGIQDAARKRRIDNGPWAGSVFISSVDKVQRTVSQSKWDKGRDYILNLVEILDKDKNRMLEYKHLERVRGFLCHLAMTYEILFPFLKGFHLALCSHLPNRDEEGWKVKDLEWIGFLEERISQGKMTEKERLHLLEDQFDFNNAPKLIKVGKRFHTCLRALEKFFSLSSPPIITDRSTNIQMAVYGFVDASKSGFGASIDHGNEVTYRMGIWGRDTEKDSSNYREFANLVETLEEESLDGRLDGAMLIVATDNSTVESAVYKGNSTNEKLFDLVVRLRLLELKVGGKFIISHVSGKRMVHQGTDGISRGHLREGITVANMMLDFCPWHKSALDRSPQLIEWLKRTFGRSLEVLTPEGWFTRGHDHIGSYKDEKGFTRLKIKKGMFVWSPPPAAAEVAMEELRKARLKRRDSTHLVVIPKLMTPLWLKQMHKACDIVFPIKPTHPFWNSNMFEPFMMGIIFPFIPHRPWQLRRTPKLLSVARELCRVQAENTEVDPGIILRELLRLTKRLPTMQASMVWKVLYFR